MKKFREGDIPNGWLKEEDYFKKLQTHPTCFYELVDFYADDAGDFEILLERRSPNDAFYAKQFATLGSTVMMRENFPDFCSRHADRESGIPVDTLETPPWVFCGVLSTPNTKRQHGLDVIFARKWEKKPDVQPDIEWYPLTELSNMNIVPSICEVIDIAQSVMVTGGPPTFREFLGTD